MEEGTVLSPDIVGWTGKFRVMLPRGEMLCDCKITRVKWTGIALSLDGMNKSGASEQLRDYLETQLGDVW